MFCDFGVERSEHLVVLCRPSRAGLFGIGCAVTGAARWCVSSWLYNGRDTVHTCCGRACKSFLRLCRWRSSQASFASPLPACCCQNTLAAALWPGAQNFPDVEAVLSTQLVSVDTFDSSRNAHLLTLHLPRCTHRFCMRMHVDMVRADRENENQHRPPGHFF